jgi:FAD-NAD(P)-binding
MARSDQDSFSVIIVGAGPRGIGILERLLANAGDLAPGRPVHIALVDPYPPGAGRVWREEQPTLMLMNAPAENVTMFTDDTVKCAGPIRTGPSLAEWLACGNAGDNLVDVWFASRRTLGRYLQWVFRHVVAERPADVSVSVLPALAIRLEGGGEAPQLVWLANRAEPLRAEVVILALGHLDGNPWRKADREMTDFAARHGLRYLPPCYTVDADLSVFRAGQNLILRGFGLAFIDIMVLLTEGRGGKYRDEENGRLSYLPCGEEPRLYVGSRRGIPYRSKFSYRLGHTAGTWPRFFDTATVAAAAGGPNGTDFRGSWWPLIAKEIGWCYYQELFAAHPGRVRSGWQQFSARYADLDWYSPEMRRLVAGAVPLRADRLDFESLDRPLRHLRFPHVADLQRHVRDHIAADVGRRCDPAYSADMAAFHALLNVHERMAAILPAVTLTARSEAEDLAGWWQSFFDYYGSGPPGLRLRQLHALSRAGIVSFLGAEMRVTADEKRGLFTAGSGSIPGTVESGALIEARLPAPDLPGCSDRLLHGLYRCGEAAEHVLADGNGFRHGTGLLAVSASGFQILDRLGRPHPRRHAIGPYTNMRYFATFARPRSNALSFRQNDEIARTALKTLLKERSP